MDRDWDELIKKVIEWGEERNITNLHTQALKICEEWGETVSELNHNKFGTEFEDGLGDTLVSLIIFAHLANKDLYTCLEGAYNEIKDRKGQSLNGNFIKD